MADDTTASAPLGLRMAIEHRAHSSTVAIASERYLLPTSRGFDQAGSDLCWAYAALNALETLHLTRFPDYPIELSRGFIQHVTWKDRLERRLTDPRGELSDRGTAMNALLLASSIGMAQYTDYPDISHLYQPDIDSILNDVSQWPVTAQPIQTIASALDGAYGVLPTSTCVGGTRLSTLEFGKRLIGDTPWTSYAVANESHSVGWASDPDTSGRGDYQVCYTPLDDMKSRIHSALMHGAPVIFSDLEHVVLIYGADYDVDGNATAFYVKDSYPDYFYRASPTDLYREMRTITTLGQ